MTTCNSIFHSLHCNQNTGEIGEKTTEIFIKSDTLLVLHTEILHILGVRLQLRVFITGLVAFVLFASR